MKPTLAAQGATTNGEPMKRFIIPIVTIAALTFATHADAGPIRNLVAKLRGKPKAAAAKVLDVAKLPLRCLRGRCGK